MDQQSNDLSGKGPSRRESLDFELLYLLEREPGLSQRELAARLDISLGKANYCLKGLIEKGAVKIANFRASENKLGYVYVLTPGGISQRAGLTRRFLERKLAQYARLKAQIEALERDLPEGERAGDMAPGSSRGLAGSR